MLKLELPDSITHVVKNTTDELTINVGKTLGDIWYLIFDAVYFYGWAYRVGGAGAYDVSLPGGSGYGGTAL